MSGACLGATVAALVDGELDHASREKAQRHLAHCASCRAEVEAHRTLKARLSRLTVATPDPQAAFTDRLLELTAAGADRVAGGATAPVRPVTLRSPARPGGPRPTGRARALRRRTAVGSAVAALGVAVLALGSPQTAATTPVDPGADRFVVQHVDTTSEVPSAVRAGLTGGGPRGSR
jgi:anti-sigma factor RsiW